MAQGVSRKESIQAIAVIITFTKVYGGGGTKWTEDINNKQFVERKASNKFNFAAMDLPGKRLKWLSLLVCTRTLGRVP